MAHLCRPQVISAAQVAILTILRPHLLAPLLLLLLLLRRPSITRGTTHRRRVGSRRLLCS
jgi:hypothetical protein